eukprot:SAG11_NODE_1302_length_5254_cov_4.749758_3_plen_115_part_00
MTMRGVPGRAAPLRCTVLLPSVGRLGLRPCVTMLVPRSTFATDSRDGVPEIKSAGMASSTSVMTVNAPKDTSLEVRCGLTQMGKFRNEDRLSAFRPSICRAAYRMGLSRLSNQP